MSSAQCSDDFGNPVHAQRFFMTVSTHSDATVTSGLESDSVPSPIPVPRLNDVLTLLSLEHSLFPQIFEWGICQRIVITHVTSDVSKVCCERLFVRVLLTVIQRGGSM